MRPTLLLVPLLLSLPFAGCIDAVRDQGERLRSSSSDVPVTVELTAAAVTDGARHVDALALHVTRVLLHRAGGTDDEWFVLSSDPAEAALVTGGHGHGGAGRAARRVLRRRPA